MPDSEKPRATYFLRVGVQNVRCFGPEVQTLVLSDPHGRPARWTIILGENGTGKTTLLQILAGFQSVPYQPIGFEDTPYPVPRVVLYFQSDHALEILRRPQGKGFIEAGIRQSETIDSSTSEDESDVYRFGLSRSSIQTFKSSLEPPICYGYGANRRPAGPNLSLEGRPGDGAATLFADDVVLRGAEEWLLKLDYSASKPSAIRHLQERRLEQVKALLSEVLPDVSDIRFTEPTKVNPTPSVEFHTPYGWVSLRSLGLGYRSMVEWMVDLASRLVERYPESANPLAEAAVVLLDEIDLHLHPSWQRNLIVKLTQIFSNTQFIVTAHSPLIVQGAGDANVVVLRREGDHVRIDDSVKTVRGWRIDQILTSDLFGLPTARPAEFDEKLARRKKLLAKPRLSKAERREVDKLDSEIMFLPAGENDSDARRILSLAEESRELLKRYGG